MLKTQAIIWATALGLVGLMNTGLYLDHGFAQRAALVSSARDLAVKYAAAEAALIDPATLGVESNYTLGIGKGSMDYGSLFRASAAREDARAIHEGTYGAVRKAIVYRADASVIKASDPRLDVEQTRLVL
ncbi:MAG: hypothetical protein AAGH82_08090, partial [Pseudomonadota bacterium]